MSFDIWNHIFLIGLSMLCVLPLIHVFAVSFSSSSAASGGLVRLWPVDFTPAAYHYSLTKPEFIRSLLVSVQRLVIGSALNMLLTVLATYPLSKEVAQFRWRTAYTWFFVFTMLFNGGLIPNYIVVRNMGLLDSLWALVLPGAVPIFNVILLLNFFRALPKELTESAFVDGAGHWKTLWSIMVPLSKPALATIFLFTCVMHWNSWFDGLIYMNSPMNYPLQTYLHTVVVTIDFSTAVTEEELLALAALSNRSVKAAQIFLGSLPILLLYPFLQKHFVKGIVLGSVKE